MNTDRDSHTAREALILVSYLVICALAVFTVLVPETSDDERTSEGVAATAPHKDDTQ